jgi:hypothetical protein
LRNVTSAQVNKLQDKLQYIDVYVCYLTRLCIWFLSTSNSTSVGQYWQVIYNQRYTQIATEILVAITQVFEDTDFQDND